MSKSVNQFDTHNERHPTSIWVNRPNTAASIPISHPPRLSFSIALHVVNNWLNMKNLKKMIFLLSESFLFLILSFASIFHASPIGHRQGSKKIASVNATLILISSVLSFVTLLMPVLAPRHAATSSRQVDPSAITNTSINQTAASRSRSENAANNGGAYFAEGCKDQFGIAFGSVILPLLFYNISGKSNCDIQYYSQSNDESQMQIYSVLIAGVGASFAIASGILCPLSAYTTILSTTIPLHKLRRQYDILRCLKRIYPIMCAIIVGTCGIIKVPTESQHESFYQQIIQQDPSSIATCVVFATVQFMLILCYNINMNTSRYQGPSHHPLLSTSSLIHENPISHVFTIGEWIGITSLLSFLLTQYILANIVMKNLTYNPSTQHIPSELFVSQAGFLGCLIGSTIPLKPIILVLQALVSRTKCSWIQRMVQMQSITMKCVTRLIIVVLVTLIVLEYALSVHCDQIGRQEEWCSAKYAKADLFSGASISVVWLGWFLRQSNDSSINMYEIVERHSWMSISKSSPNYSWLGYWAVAIMVLAPVAVLIAKKLQYLRLYGNGNVSKKKLTVMARKYFHFVAVVLFLPPTFYAPGMMTLSYAIALAILILVESMRVVLFWERGAHIGGSCDENNTLTDPSVRTKDTSSLTINQFFETFFDEKDQCAAAGSFAVTHLALILGCAMPLWIHQVAHAPQSAANSNHNPDSEDMDCIVPFLGIIVLGIGDAAGALCGSMFGNTRWPMSKRTVEGSVAMFLSMVISDDVIRGTFGLIRNIDLIYKGALYLYLPLTILEAVTLQIDNLCLPLVALVLASLL